MEKALSQGREPVLGPTELLTQWLTQEDPCPPPPILGFGSWEMKGFACISKVFLRVLASVPFLKSQPSPFKDPEVLVTEDNVKSLHCTHKGHKTSRPYSIPVARASALEAEAGKSQVAGWLGLHSKTLPQNKKENYRVILQCLASDHLPVCRNKNKRGPEGRKWDGWKAKNSYSGGSAFQSVKD